MLQFKKGHLVIFAIITCSSLLFLRAYRYMCVWETNLSQWTLTPIQKSTGAFCEEFMSSSESVWKQQFFATLLTDPVDLTHLSKPIIPFSPSLLLHLDQSPIETSNRTVLSYFVFSLFPILPHAIPKKNHLLGGIRQARKSVITRGTLGKGGKIDSCRFVEYFPCTKPLR